MSLYHSYGRQHIQRENLLFSEKAYAYKMKLEAIKKQGKRTDLTSAQVVPKLTAREQVAKDTGVNHMEIIRYIRLTELITDLLDMTGERKIAFNTAIELSYLSHDEQAMLHKKIKDSFETQCKWAILEYRHLLKRILVKPKK